ncbi:MAG TPA: AAA family ATPase [Baekduia sp.]|uniref:helix-turn-helix transcriptional regulator n=1 Tax=Baekduia sp. TaxID=2600305 RepID=UPI002D79FEB1|nr:AAA family ATPase [Baekduia sp.]HET6508633.1 AAA family ATPase [Baekduia sp.]
MRAGTLLERERETSLLDDAIGAGEPGVVLIEGPAGCGKSRLLDHAARAAAGADAGADAGAGRVVLRARALELERAFTFGVARQLVAPLARRWDDRRWAGGVALGDDRRLAIAHALRALLAEAAAEAGAPLVLVVDDLHWADTPSLAWLATLAEGIERPALLIAAARAGEPDAPEELLDRVRAVAGARVVVPAPLGGGAVRALAAERLGGEPDAAFVAACAEATGGNPFLLAELLAELAVDGAAPSAATAARIGGLVPATVLRALAARVRSLPDDQLALARAAAIIGHDAPLTTVAGLASLDAPRAAAAADALAAAHLLADGEPVALVHPLVGAALRETIGAHTRARMHARAAALLAADGAPDQAVAAQLVEAPPGAAPGAGRTLLKASDAAIAHGDPGTATRLLARALDEPLADADRDAAQIALAFAATASGTVPDDPALERLLAAVGGAQRAEAQLALAYRAYLRTDIDGALRAIGAGLAEPDAAPHVRARLEDLRLAARVHFPEGRADVRELAEAGPPFSAVQRGILACEAAVLGRTPADVRSLIDPIALTTLPDDLLSATIVLSFAVVALLWVDELDAAEAMLDAVQPVAQRVGSLTAAGAASYLRAHLLLRQGRPQEAIDEMQPALELSARGWEMTLQWSAARLGRAHVERGDLAGARAALELADDDPGLDRPFLLEARGDLAMAESDPAAAAARYLEAGAELEALAIGAPGAVPWQAKAALALVRAGDRERAAALAEAAVAIARAAGARRAWALGLRARAAVTQAIAPLEEAVALLDGSGLELERAYALADLGAALRRAGRPRDARAPLREALAVAEARGADPLARRAHGELRAAGGRRGPRARPDADTLTAGERRVAALAAAGRSNPEIAAELFLTRKTVEWHLGRVYRKLGISSRAALAEASF